MLIISSLTSSATLGSLNLPALFADDKISDFIRPVILFNPLTFFAGTPDPRSFMGFPGDALTKSGRFFKNPVLASSNSNNSRKNSLLFCIASDTSAAIMAVALASWIESSSSEMSSSTWIAFSIFLSRSGIFLRFITSPSAFIGLGSRCGAGIKKSSTSLFIITPSVGSGKL